MLNIQITENAAQRIQSLYEKNPEKLLIIALKKGGCAGTSYDMQWVENPEQGVEIIEENGVKIGIAPSAQMFLIGTVIDFQQSALESGFTFDNPNVVESCGCGESVSFEVNHNGQNPSKPPIFS